MGAHAVIMVTHFKVPVTKMNWHNAKMLFSASRAKKWQKKLFSSPKKGFLGPQNKVFHVLWPPEAKNDPPSENTKKNDLKKL